MIASSSSSAFLFYVQKGNNARYKFNNSILQFLDLLFEGLGSCFLGSELILEPSTSLLQYYFELFYSLVFIACGFNFHNLVRIEIF